MPFTILAALWPVQTTTPASAAKAATPARTAPGSVRSPMHHRRKRRTGKQRSSITSFDPCVANHEAGEPGSESFDTINWHIVDNGYEGAYQWDPSTWASAGGLKYGSASSASPEDQTRVFNSYEPRDPGAWPRSVPACGGP